MKTQVSSHNEQSTAIQALNIDVSEVKRFITALRGTPDARVTFQTFDERKGSQRDRSLSTISHGTIDERVNELNYLLRRGASIFMMVNEGDFNGRGEENVIGVKAFFFDDDQNRKLNLPIPPSLVVRTKRGTHGYYILSDAPSLQVFTEVQTMIAEYLDTDRAVSDLSRVMRIPGSYHLKDPFDPAKTFIEEQSNLIYTEAQIRAAFVYEKEIKKVTQSVQVRPRKVRSLASQARDLLLSINVKKEPSSIDWFAVFEKVGYPYLNERRRTKRFPDYYEVRCPNFKNHSDPEVLNGSRLFVPNGRIAGFECQHNHCRHLNILDVIRCFPAEVLDECASEPIMSEGEKMADEFASLIGMPVRNYNAGFYRYTGACYEKLKDDWIEKEAGRFLQLRFSKFKSLRSAATELLTHLASKYNTADKPIPFWIKSSPYEEERLIPLKSGLFRVDEYLRNADSADVLIPHTADYFSLNALPYDFDPRAAAPRWIKFLNDMIPDEELQGLLQEFIGLCLIHETTFNKMMFLVGDGANGKSVVLSVLRCLIGERNTSAVGLEAFSPKRTFPLAQTVGKLVNIIPELGELDRAEEGLIKSFVGGELLTVERKFKDSYEMVPTARLICATNSMPHLKDRSDGIFRRLLIIPMTKQILDESQQDKRLIDPKFWIESGEVPGIFNWALEGLKRLLERRRFVEPAASLKMKEKYRSDLNPASGFLADHLRSADMTKRVLSRELYAAYVSWCRFSGYRPLGVKAFSDEIRRKFPKAEKSENGSEVEQVNGGKDRGHFWSGLEVMDSSSFTALMNGYIGGGHVA